MISGDEVNRERILSEIPFRATDVPTCGTAFQLVRAASESKAGSEAQLRQIYLAIWTNIFDNLDKYIQRRVPIWESCSEVHSWTQGANALCVLPFKNLEIKNIQKWWPWLPFSQARIISDKIFGCCLLCSFTFNLYLGTSWKQSSAAVEFPKNQLQFKQAAARMRMKLRGPVDHSP